MSSPEPLCGALAGFTLVRFLVFYILANWFPNHRIARTSKPEYSLLNLDIGSVTEIYKNNGYDITLVQQLLQHSSAAITQRYIGIETQRIEENIEGYAQLL